MASFLFVDHCILGGMEPNIVFTQRALQTQPEGGSPASLLIGKRLMADHLDCRL